MVSFFGRWAWMAGRERWRTALTDPLGGSSAWPQAGSGVRGEANRMRVFTLGNFGMLCGPRPALGQVPPDGWQTSFRGRWACERGVVEPGRGKSTSGVFKRMSMAHAGHFRDADRPGVASMPCVGALAPMVSHRLVRDLTLVRRVLRTGNRSFASLLLGGWHTWLAAHILAIAFAFPRGRFEVSRTGAEYSRQI